MATPTSAEARIPTARSGTTGRPFFGGRRLGLERLSRCRLLLARLERLLALGGLVLLGEGGTAAGLLLVLLLRGARLVPGVVAGRLLLVAGREELGAGEEPGARGRDRLLARLGLGVRGLGGRLVGLVLLRLGPLAVLVGLVELLGLALGLERQDGGLERGLDVVVGVGVRLGPFGLLGGRLGDDLVRPISLRSRRGCRSGTTRASRS